ncbi:hypothetical protein SAMN05216359_109142 [Roseateles sp. YR242]|nr:hypothetical protein SAMN05216359_109142 [Roseateles sp. YR242]
MSLASERPPGVCVLRNLHNSFRWIRCVFLYALALHGCAWPGWALDDTRKALGLEGFRFVYRDGQQYSVRESDGPGPVCVSQGMNDRAEPGQKGHGANRPRAGAFQRGALFAANKATKASRPQAQGSPISSTEYEEWWQDSVRESDGSGLVCVSQGMNDQAEPGQKGHGANRPRAGAFQRSPLVAAKRFPAQAAGCTKALSCAGVGLPEEEEKVGTGGSSNEPSAAALDIGGAVGAPTEAASPPRSTSRATQKAVGNEELTPKHPPFLPQTPTDAYDFTFAGPCYSHAPTNRSSLFRADPITYQRVRNV